MAPRGETIKKLTTLILAVLFLFSCSTVQPKAVINQKPQTYTYDGDIDPVEFYGWTPIKGWTCEKGHFHIVLTNPDKDAEISMVETINISGKGQAWIIVAYRYLKGRVIHGFSFNPRTLNFDRWDTITDKSGGI